MDIIYGKSSVEYQIAEKLLAMKDIGEKSWFNYIRAALELYNLPFAYTLLHQDKQNRNGRDLQIAQKLLREKSWKIEDATKSSLK